ncbi:MAG: NAD(+) diphosphatase [Lachnospiraceae bacterium]
MLNLNMGLVNTFHNMRKLAVKWKIPSSIYFSIDGVAYFLPEAEAFGADAMQRLPEGVRLAAAGAVSDGQTAGSCVCSSDGLSAGRMVPDALRIAVRAHRMVHIDIERMMHCTSCGLMEYPKICPAVIVGVTKGDESLLTRYAGRSYKKYALIAGFAEVGETIEETVHREVMEEVGLKVKNLHYYKSQPWSASSTLLMGFFCEADGDDEIRLDQSELAEARWCPRAEVPEWEDVSLTMEMMQVFRTKGILEFNRETSGDTSAV